MSKCVDGLLACHCTWVSMFLVAVVELSLSPFNSEKFFVAVVASAALCIHVYRCMALTVKHLPFIVMTFPLIIYFCLPLGVATLKFSWLLFNDVTFQLKWTFAALMWLGNAFREFSLLVLVF